jgi:hypothetical protein
VARAPATPPPSHQPTPKPSSRHPQRGPDLQFHAGTKKEVPPAVSYSCSSLASLGSAACGLIDRGARAHGEVAPRLYSLPVALRVRSGAATEDFWTLFFLLGGFLSNLISGRGFISFLLRPHSGSDLATGSQGLPVAYTTVAAVTRARQTATVARFFFCFFGKQNSSLPLSSMQSLRRPVGTERSSLQWELPASTSVYLSTLPNLPFGPKQS